ncbi:pseudouridine synthase [Aldersonia kunmingensis]|uniref:pseudouridine synthase n=1 Tax=Aldersonia kunmingensis TaxID=408066 RepID=UPI0008316F2C|nr:pseudouridine synthase [Aldersonia kunmingensis]
MLPVRDGLNPSRLRLPPGDWPTVLVYLLERFPSDAVRLREKVAADEVVDGRGAPISEQTPYRSGDFVYLYRDPPVETPVPFDVEILHRDDDLLVVDKPHFLASTPRGGFIVETALVRLRRKLDLPELSPAHRLDRLTAGVLLFTVHRAARRDYQMLFAQRLVQKQYEAIAGFDPAAPLPLLVRSHIVKRPGVLQAQEIPGPDNSETRIELIESRDALARYSLLPTTGKTHQLRVHLNSLGIPIVGDPLYPDVLDIAPDDYRNPLRLLARRLTFDDPRTGQSRTFTSRRTLDWPD